MATIFSHALVGYTLSQVAPVPKNRGFVFWMILLPIVPDFDYVGWVAKVPYDSFWGHRGFTHSILFALMMAILAALMIRQVQKWKVVLFLFLATISHAILDAFTNGGLGVAFFSPYNTARYFFPWQPIEVSPIGPRFFSEQGLVVLISELWWIGLPCFAILLIAKLKEKFSTSN